MDEAVVKDLDGVLANCVLKIKVCCGTLFPEIFYAPFSGLHDKIFELIDAGHSKIAIAAPRGIGKTSIARTVANRAILFRLSNFIVYLSNSATSAEMQTENMKRDLLSGKEVRQLFGSIKDNIKTAGIMDESFSKMSWVAFGSTLVLPRGAGQQVRGLNWSNYRPELVIIDDLEDKDEIRNEANRIKLRDWFDSDLLKTEGRYGKKCQFIYIDTIKHEDSILADLLESPEWASIQLSICDDNYNTLDENYMTTEEILAEVEEHRRKGTLDTFYMERMNIPISKEDAVFKADSFRYFDDRGDKLFVEGDADSEGKDKLTSTYQLLHITIVDPARTVKLQSADSAVLTVAIDRMTRRIFVREIVSKKFYPDEMYDEMFRQVKVFGSFILGYDAVGLSNFITQPIENECRLRSVFPLLIELPARRSKEERVATLAPLYRLGYIYHNKANCGKLEGQLLGFPRSKLWDVMDGLAYITYIMDKHAVYFDPPDDVMEDPPEDDYADLDNDPMMSAGQMGLLC